MPVGAFVPSRIHLDYPEWTAPGIAYNGQVWAWNNASGKYEPTALAFDPAGAGLTAAQVWSYATRTLTALGSAAGVEFTYTVTDSATTNPIADVSVWFSTNSGITNVVWYGSTDAFGVARDANGNKPRLDSGTYYILCRKTGFSFTVDTETVS